jgi:hypothetical protein
MSWLLIVWAGSAASALAAMICKGLLRRDQTRLDPR